MSYSGPIYFEPVRVPACKRCPSAQALSCQHLQRTQAAISHASPSASLFEAAEDFEWMRIDSEARIDSLTARRSRKANKPSCLNDVPRRRSLASSSSFDSLLAPERTQALLTRRYEAAEMTPDSHSRNSRSTTALQSHERANTKIRERSRSSQVALSNVSAPSFSPPSQPFPKLPSSTRTGDHDAHDMHGRIWSWVSGVDRGQQPLLHHSATRRSASLHIPCDVDLDRDLYSPRALASSLNSHLSVISMSPSGSSCSSPLPGERVPHFDFTSFMSDCTAERCLNDWHYMMDDIPSAFLTSSPCPSSHSSTMGFASTLPRERSNLDETMYRTLLDRWSESGEWRGEEYRERDESIPGVHSDYNMDAYPRSATSSSRHSEAEEAHLVDLPNLLDQHGFSTLLLQSFTLALAESSLNENESVQHCAAAQTESDDDRLSILSCPTYLQDFDFMDQWSPPALRSSSSASSLDPFQLELFSPTSEQPDPATVWDAHRSPGNSSDSPGFFSSSPFVAWSSTSENDMKSTFLGVGLKGDSSPFSEVPLYQPQPIRPIPLIDIPINMMV